jgi:hypothetical protein
MCCCAYVLRKAEIGAAHLRTVLAVPGLAAAHCSAGAPRGAPALVPLALRWCAPPSLSTAPTKACTYARALLKSVMPSACVATPATTAPESLTIQEPVHLVVFAGGVTSSDLHNHFLANGRVCMLHAVAPQRDDVARRLQAAPHRAATGRPAATRPRCCGRSPRPSCGRRVQVKPGLHRSPGSHARPSCFCAAPCCKTGSR